MSSNSTTSSGSPENDPTGVALCSLFMISLLTVLIYSYRKRPHIELFTEQHFDLWQPRIGPLWFITTWRVVILCYFLYWLIQSYVWDGLFVTYYFFTNWTLSVFCTYFACTLWVTFRGLKQGVTMLGYPEKALVLTLELCLVTTVVVFLVFWTLLAK